MDPIWQVGTDGNASFCQEFACTNCSVWPFWTLFWEGLVEPLSAEDLWASLKGFIHLPIDLSSIYVTYHLTPTVSSSSTHKIHCLAQRGGTHL